MKKQLKQGPCPTCGQLVIVPPEPVPCDHEKRLLGESLDFIGPCDLLDFIRPCDLPATWTIVLDPGESCGAIVGNYCPEHVARRLTASLEMGRQIGVYPIGGDR